MLRAIVELLLTIAVITVARAVIIGLMRGISSSASASGNSQSRGQSPKTPEAGVLHKDPVCGTFVSESTRFQRRIGQQDFFYCSDDCRVKHVLAAQ